MTPPHSAAGGEPRPWPATPVRIATAVALAAAIFIFDTFRAETFTVAVLYVVVIMLSMTFTGTRGVLIVGGACGGLTLLSYGLVHHGAVGGALARCAVSLSAIAITTTLAVRSLQSTEALRARERRYRTIFDSAGAMLWEEDWSQVLSLLQSLRTQGVRDLARHLADNPHIIDEASSKARLIDANEATLKVLAAPDKASLLAAQDEVRQAATNAFSEILQALWEGRDQVQADTFLNTLDGRRIAVHFVLTFPAEGREQGWAMGSIFDVSERNRAQEALMEAQSALAHVSRVTALGELTASIAHEVNQPLAAIVTNGQATLRFLDLDPPPLDEVREGVRQSVADADRASAVVARLRALARKSPRQTEPVDLGVLVEETVRLVERQCSQNQVTMALDLAHEGPGPLGDRIELQQVLLNLMLNGVHAMEAVEGRERRLTVSTWRRDDRAGVSVTDTGVGLGSDGAMRLFDAFYTTRPDGLGMGLSICRSIVETHGGRIWAGDNPEHGATFSFELPVGERA
ncbi:sensor histidine kinase [Caulobacter sp. NIBR2454]|uniref:sensor histidine kinase n=1 Tax=Caulobacter sp. NIBR2454 TaxID=3015996 RepID=UPI0022B70BA4|nr:ATP-binding protein [Caulobacter sp. NIBR2454]